MFYGSFMLKIAKIREIEWNLPILNLDFSNPKTHPHYTPNFKKTAYNHSKSTKLHFWPLPNILIYLTVSISGTKRKLHITTCQT